MWILEARKEREVALWSNCPCAQRTVPWEKSMMDSENQEQVIRPVPVWKQKLGNLLNWKALVSAAIVVGVLILWCFLRGNAHATPTPALNLPTVAVAKVI